MVGSHPFPISHRLAPAEGARSAGDPADGSCLARLWRACRAYDRRMDIVCQASRPARGIATTFATGANGIHLARMLFAVSLIPIGLSHLVYVKQTAELVPAWLPYRVGWAYLTGAGQIACGLGLLFSIFPRVAARAEAGMISLFTLLVWGPAILAAPRTRLPWTAFFISWAIASAAWVVAQNIAPKQPAKSEV
jgi:uncharacterized membrane protein